MGLPYIEITLNKSSIDKLSQLVERIVPIEQYYKSPVVDYINGNVTNTAHLTLYYGIDTKHIESAELKEILSNHEIDCLEVKDIRLVSGYQNLYQILWLEIDDKENKLQNLSEKLRQFKSKESPDQEFKPHITLAYIENSFQLKDKIDKTNLYLEVAETRIIC